MLRIWIRLWLLLIGALLSIVDLEAETPAVTHIYPVGAAPGSTQICELIGKVDPWPSKVDIHGDGLTITALEESGKIEISVDDSAAPGPRLIRFHNEDGAASPLHFVVGPRPHEIQEEEPNDHYRDAKLMPHEAITINGRLQRRGDVDSFGVHLEEGQTFVARLDAFSLGSPVDALFHLRDRDGYLVAFNHDGVHFDPALAWTADRSGDYVLQVMGFRYPANNSEDLGGGDDYIYRLHLHTGPAAFAPLPLRRSAGDPVEPQIVGWNLGCDIAPIKEFPELTWEPGLPSEGILSDESADNAWTPPFGVSDVIEDTKVDESIWFQAQKDQRYQLTVESIAFGDATDLRFELFDSEGALLTRDDDSGSGQNPAKSWIAKNDGTYRAQILANVFNPQSPFVYRFSVEPDAPRYEAQVQGHTFAIDPGAELEIKVAISRIHDYDASLELRAQGLPSSISCNPITVNKDAKEATLKLVCAPETEPWSGPFTITSYSLPESAPKTLAAELVSSGINNGVPQGFPHLMIKNTERLWVTIKPKEKGDATANE